MSGLKPGPWSFYIFNEGRYMKICGILSFFGRSERFALYQGTTLVVPYIA